MYVFPRSCVTTRLDKLRRGGKGTIHVLSLFFLYTNVLWRTQLSNANEGLDFWQFCVCVHIFVYTYICKHIYCICMKFRQRNIHLVTLTNFVCIWHEWVKYIRVPPESQRFILWSPTAAFIKCSQRLLQHVSKMPNLLMEQHNCCGQWLSPIKQMNGRRGEMRRLCGDCVTGGADLLTSYSHALFSFLYIQENFV